MRKDKDGKIFFLQDNFYAVNLSNFIIGAASDNVFHDQGTKDFLIFSSSFNMPLADIIEDCKSLDSDIMLCFSTGVFNGFNTKVFFDKGDYCISINHIPSNDENLKALLKYRYLCDKVDKKFIADFAKTCINLSDAEKLEINLSED